MTQTRPPVARRGDHRREHHGHVVTDPWEWLRDGEDPEVLAHLEAENDWARARTAHLEGLREDIFEEIRRATRETDLSVPVRSGGWWYYTRTVAGQQYPVHARVRADGPERPALEGGEPPTGEQVLLDGNAAAAGHEFFALGAFEVSPDHSRLAYSVDLRGDERFDLVVVDLATGQTLDDSLTGLGYSAVFTLGGTHLYYVRVDDAWRPHQVWRHEIGADPSTDELIHQEDDETYWMDIDVSRDDRVVTIGLASRTTSEWHLLDAADVAASPVLVQPRTEGLEYDVEPAGDRLLIVHNRAHVDFELAQCPLDLATPGAMGAQRWEQVTPPQEGERVVAVEAFARHLVVHLRRGGLTALRVMPRGADGAGVGEPWLVETGEEVHTVSTGSNPEYDVDTLQVTVESLVTPRSVLEIDLGSGQRTLLKQTEVLGGYDPQEYVQWREWATAADGARIPMSCVARRDTPLDGTAPALVYGYGSYEISVEPRFSVPRLSLLDRGVVHVIAHVRGGGEMGRSWYEQGRLAAKATTFTDFVACADHLAAAGLVDGERMAAAGGSAGGLLMGAVMNLAPGRFRVVHAAVPFVDALTTILDPSLPLTVGEWDEWGDPLHDPEIYTVMRGYSPYENVTQAQYPAVLATTSLNDTRVLFVEPAKWVQRLREAATNDPVRRPILLRTEMVAGHGGRSGRYDTWRDIAFEHAFVLDQLAATERVDG